MLSAGVIIAGGTVRRSVLSPQVRGARDALVEGSVLFDGVQVGNGALIRNAIVDKNVVVAPGAQIGVDIERDRSRFTVSANGIVAIGKGAIVMD